MKKVRMGDGLELETYQSIANRISCSDSYSHNKREYRAVPVAFMERSKTRCDVPPQTDSVSIASINQEPAIDIILDGNWNLVASPSTSPCADNIPAEIFSLAPDSSLSL